MSLLHNEALLKYFCCLEREFQVNRYVAGGVHVWPSVRLSLTQVLHNIDAATDPKLTSDPNWRAVVARILDRYERTEDPIIRPAPDRPIEAFLDTIHPSGVSDRWAVFDAMFFTRPEEHFLRTSGGYYAPIQDPWFERAGRHFRVAKVELLSNLSLQKAPRRHPPILTTPLLAAVDLPSDDARLLDALRDQTRRLCEVVATWSRDAFGFSLNSFEAVALANLDVVARVKVTFDSLFRTAPAKTVFLNCFYHPPAHGLLWSAREHGIRTVEIQHGINGEDHVGYTHWIAPPPTGYHMLPEIFLTWGVSSANNVARWLPPEHGFHKVVIGGKPLVDAGDEETDGAAVDRLRAGFSRTVLITLQSTAGTGFSDAMLTLIRQAPVDWLWLVRGHPLGAEMPTARPEYIEETTRGAGISNVECRIATRMSLDGLLRRSDHHLTCSSSVALEGIRHDVPTTFINPLGMQFHRRLIESRGAYYALAPEEIIDTIKRGRDGLDWSRARDEVVNDPALTFRLINDLCA